MFFKHLAVVGLLSLAACASKEDGQTGDDQNVTGVQQPSNQQNPAVGNPDRAKFMAGVHAKLDAQIHNQPSEYLVSWLQSKNGYTFMEAECRGKAGSKINWKNTDFKADVEEGFFDLNTDRQGNDHVYFTVLAKKQPNGSFSVVDIVVAPTDVSLAGTSAGAPPEIFPIPIGEGGDGDGDGDGRGDGRGG